MYEPYDPERIGPLGEESMMLSERPLEYCFVCDEPTGRAGQGDGSLYCECDKGPFCEECWEKHHSADTKVAQLEAETEALGILLSNLVDVELERDKLESDNAALQKQIIIALPYIQQLRDSVRKGNLIVDSYMRFMIDTACEALEGGDDAKRRI